MARTKNILPLEAALAPGQKPTLKTIAQMSGLAVPTVSRALNDAPDIGQDTKRIVRKIADDIGYVPNRAGVRLRTGRTNVISLIISTEHDNHTARLISSVAGGLRGTRYHLNVTPFVPGEDALKPVKYIVETRSADAIILNQIEPADPRIAYLMERGIPFATHGRTQWQQMHPYYDFDNEAYGGLAIDMLAKRGRRSLTAIVPPVSQSYSQHVIRGLSSAASAAGLHFEIMQGVTSDSSMQEIVDATQRALDGKSHDAVVVASTSAALAATAAVEQMGLTIGQEIDIVSKDANNFLKIFRREMLTVPEAVGAAGAFLSKAILQAIREPELPPMQFLEVPETATG